MNEKMITENSVLSEADACRLLNLSRTTLWRMRRAGKLRYFKLGSKIGYLLTHLHELLHNSERLENNTAQKVEALAASTAKAFQAETAN